MNQLLLVLLFLVVCLLFSRVLTMRDRALEERIWRGIVSECPEAEHLVLDVEGDAWVNETLLDEDSDDE